jgi:hypothetical protein
VLEYLILLTKRELNIRTPYRTSFIITVVKTPFSNSLLISLRRESVNRASYIKTDMSIGGSSFIGASVEVK